MKNRNCLRVLLVLMSALMLSACAKDRESSASAVSETSTQESAEQTVMEKTESPEAEDAESAKVLVVYFSATGNTKPLAEYAAEILDADLYEIVPEEPYTEEDLNYNDSSTRATVEQNDASARPAIAGTVENMEQYDTVILAYPIWWGKEPKIIDAFIETYDFSGKTMTALCTSGSSGIEASAADLQAAIPDATWLTSRRFAAGADRSEVEQWLQKTGLLK